MDAMFPLDSSDTTLRESNGRRPTSGVPEFAPRKNNLDIARARAIVDLEGELLVNNVMAATRAMLVAIGEDPNREGLQKTPYRVAKAWLTELFTGYFEDPEDYMTQFGAEGYDELIAITAIPFVSHCEHHVMPFTGTVDVGYIPNGRIVGLSKIPRLVNTYARRLQVQERLTSEIADAMELYLEPRGTIVVVKAIHSCMAMRGVKAVGSETVTSAVRGVFLDPSRGARAEFLELTRR